MAQVIKNFGELAKALQPKIVETLKLVAKDVEKEIDKALDAYYAEYNPEPDDIDKMYLKKLWYWRTEQLLNCCKVGNPVIKGNAVSIEIYLDVDSLNYHTEGANPYKTVVAANAGLHGGWNVEAFSDGQVPWSAISGNTGERFGSGTQIWEEPIQELLDKGKLVALFKKHAKARGLNLK